MPISKDILENYYSLVLNVTVTDSLSGEKSSKEIKISIYDIEIFSNMNDYQYETGKTNHFKVFKRLKYFVIKFFEVYKFLNRYH